VAERFADRRILLAGEAVHLFTPTGGFGMNTGVDEGSQCAGLTYRYLLNRRSVSAMRSIS
jgi:2-polyprenyl-6-methoxyphenol hydroxylase-like FAD-dependent oxidoreductase